MIYNHFPTELRKWVHAKMIFALKKEGKLILEAFHTSQLGKPSGGPKDLSMLYTEEILKEDLRSLTIEELKVENVNLSEGRFHNGNANVIRFFAQK